MIAGGVTIEDLKKLERRLDDRYAPSGLGTTVDKLKSWKNHLETDRSFGQLLTGPQWIDGISVVDGTVEGTKFAAEVTVSSIFKTAESPADRWELDSAGMRFYGTVSAVPNTKVIDFQSDGDVQIGTGANMLTFTASTGVLAVPAATVTGLTIAAIGTGQIGGTYRTSAADSGARLRLSTAGIEAFNSGGTRTIFLEPTGDASIVGTFTIASSTSASNRLQMSQAGIELWKSGTREFYLQAGGATNDVQMLLTGAGVGQYIGMQPDTGLWLGASTFSSANFRVSNAGVATMVGGTVASASGAGARVELTSTGLKAYSSGSTETINISGSSSTITAATLRSSASNPRVQIDSTGFHQFNAGGTEVFNAAFDGTGWVGASTRISWNGTAVTINAANVTLSNLSASSITTGTLNASSVTVTNLSFTNIQQTGTLGAGQNLGTNNITVNSTGRVTWEGGISYVDSTGMVLGSTSVLGDSIRWIRSGFTPLEKIQTITGSSQAQLYLTAQISTTGRNVGVTLNAGGTDSGTSVAVRANAGSATGGGAYVVRTSGLHEWEVDDGFVMGMTLARTNRALSLYGRLYPGTGSAANTTGYFDWDSGNTRGRWMAADFRFDQYVMLDQTGSRTSGIPGLSDKYIAFKNSAGTIWYVPAYSSTAFAD